MNIRCRVSIKPFNGHTIRGNRCSIEATIIGVVQVPPYDYFQDVGQQKLTYNSVALVILDTFSKDEIMEIPWPHVRVVGEEEKEDAST